MEHLWISVTPFWLSTDEFIFKNKINNVFWTFKWGTFTVWELIPVHDLSIMLFPHAAASQLNDVKAVKSSNGTIPKRGSPAERNKKIYSKKPIRMS